MRTTQEHVDKFNDLMCHMSRTKEQLDKKKRESTRKKHGDDDEDNEDRDRLLSEAIEFAIEQGRGWGPGEKEAYLKKILDDDFIPPLFASSVEEVEKSGLQEAFTTLIYDEKETPTSLMHSFKKKGNEAFANGKRNQAQNLQYYRDAMNHYFESLAWAEQIQPVPPGEESKDDDDSVFIEDSKRMYTEGQLKEIKSTLCANVALANLQLGNWGMVRDHSQQALQLNAQNVKAWYRLAKAHQMLQNWELAGDAIESGLAVEHNNKDLIKLQHSLDARVRKARALRQQRERARAERAARVKQVWMHCKKQQQPRTMIQLGRVSLVSRATDDDDDIGGADEGEDVSRWHQHLPHSGLLPGPATSELSSTLSSSSSSDWSWPVMFLYPSHKQSDFIPHFGESEMMALRMAELFPELDSSNNSAETLMQWDFNNEFQCSQLAVYFEVHGRNNDEKDDDDDDDNYDTNHKKRLLVHPEHVEPLQDLATCLKFYEATRALKGDEGQDVADVVRALEQKRLQQQQQAWKKKYGSLWANNKPRPVVRVHPAVTLLDVLTDSRMIVPNFLVTFLLFPENHPAHEAFLKEHKCLGILQPKELS